PGAFQVALKPLTAHDSIYRRPRRFALRGRSPPNERTKRMHPSRKWTNLALVVAALLAAGPLRAAEPDKLLPGDTAAVAVVNVRQLLDSPLGKKFLIERYQAALKENAEAQRMFAALNLDPLKDIDSVVMSASALDPDKMLLLVHGKFDLARLQTAAEDFAKK